MSLRFFDTATREVRDFVPLVPGKVGIYLCGATVQGAPHIGHLRSAIAFDVLIRWLSVSGYDVTFIRNVTDIDDKILAKSAEASAAAGTEIPWWAWANRYEREFTAAYDALGVLRPTYEPRATGHVPEMVALMDRLVDHGHAYRGAPGDVYFDVRSYPDYGSLTNQRPADLEPAEDDPTGDKRDARDFALWKAAKPGEPESASWPTPYGRGRPGWHLECSAMARRYLGDSFDIHGGGIDLRFPHHENEQAQSRAAGYGFAQYWLHNAWVTASGEKMSKSLGNALGVAALLASVPPVVLRYALGAAQYSSMIEFSEESIAEAESTWERITGFVVRAGERLAEANAFAPAEIDRAEVRALLPDAFAEAMDDDLNVPAALAVVHEHVRAGNTALANDDLLDADASYRVVRAMLDVLGIDPLSPQWSVSGDDRAAAALDALVSAELVARAEARTARDFETADAIRDRLAEAGIVVEDSPGGARWSLA